MAGLALAVAWSWSAAPAGADEERHVGYYYPQPQTVETYEARATTLPDASRSRAARLRHGLDQPDARQSLSAAIRHLRQGLERREADHRRPGYDNTYNTIYRARALFAMLTAVARLTKLFQEYRVEELFTFFDL